MSILSSVEKTVKNDLCVSCGICVKVCPQKSIQLKFKDGIFQPKVDDSCTKCSECLKVCPGINVDFEQLYYPEKLPDDILRGKAIKSLVMYSLDEAVRLHSTSGGIITQIIKALIENNEYDYVSVLKYDFYNGKPAEVRFTNDIREIMEASKSKYLPASMEKVIAQIINEPDKKYIIIGTSCHIHGIKKFLRRKKTPYDKFLFLGLFCDKTLNYNIFNYYNNSYGDKNEEIIKMDYRNKEINGWPGDTKLIFNNREITVNKEIRMKLKDFFQMNRCKFCIDKTNQLADISFGDCYIPKYQSEKGNSNVIIRTQKGSDIIERYKTHFYIEEIDTEKIYMSQHVGERLNNLKNAQNLNGINLYNKIEFKSYKKPSTKYKAKNFISNCKNSVGRRYHKSPKLSHTSISAFLFVEKSLKRCMRNK